MKKIEFWLHRFVFVYGLVMLITFFMCLLFNPTSELPVVRFFGRCILLTLVSMATLIIYASSEELTNREWWFRTILHAAWKRYCFHSPIAGAFGTMRWMV